MCSSEGAIETFIAHCDVAARDLLMPHCDSVIVLSTVLRIRRTLDGVEIDRIIGEVEAQKALAVEPLRLAQSRDFGRRLSGRVYAVGRDGNASTCSRLSGINQALARWSRRMYPIPTGQRSLRSYASGAFCIADGALCGSA
jgi:hypothetical protein